jgi:glutamate/tyrosine decarboxylase-like PLP-dependent enzyme
MIMTRHPAALGAAFRLTTAFMPAEVDDAADPYTTSIQWSRRFAGLKIFLSLGTIGRTGYAAQLERDIVLGELLAQRLAAAGFEIVNDTPLPVICFTHPETASLAPDEAWHWHVRTAERVIASNGGWISALRLAGRPALRACITSYRTTPADIDQLIQALTAALQPQHKEHRASGGLA